MTIFSPLEETTNTLEYLIDNFERYGVIDTINMHHAYKAAAIGRAALRAERATRSEGPLTNHSVAAAVSP